VYGVDSEEEFSKGWGNVCYCDIRVLRRGEGTSVRKESSECDVMFERANEVWSVKII
jgi:hypothetical protein